MVNPVGMCRQHLLGEHLEIHMFVKSVLKDKNLHGFVTNNCLEFGSLKLRHDDLVVEMASRGYKHSSPLEQPSTELFYLINSRIDRGLSLQLLHSRCLECLDRHSELLS